MDPPNIIDLVIEEKQFSGCQMISGGKFSATIEVDAKDKQKKVAVLLITKNKSESRKFDLEKMMNAYTVQAIQYEYMPKLQTHLIYTETGVCSLKEKIDNKLFRKSPLAIESVFDWIKQVSMGLKKLHSTGYVHLNIHPNTIVITSDNRAKISGFNFARHISTERESYETGSEACYRPPESFVHIGINGMKYDTWCLAVLTAEALTKNYIAQKSKGITTWPQQYNILYKVLKPRKFKKLVRKAYPTASESTNLDKSLLLIKHTMKFYPGQRPDVGEFYLLLFELTFRKDIDKELTEEKIWKKKGSRNKEIIVFPLEYMYLHQSEELPSVLESSESKKVEIRKPDLYEKGDANNDLRENSDEDSFFSEQKHHILQDSDMFLQDPVFNILDLAVRKEDADIGETTKSLNKNNLHQPEVLPPVLENSKSKKIEIGIPDPYEKGDAKYDLGENTDEKTFFSGQKTNILQDIFQEIIIPDPYEKGDAKNDLIENTDEKTFFSKQKIDILEDSEMLLHDPVFDDLDLAARKEDADIGETVKSVNNNNEEKGSKSIFSVKRIFQKIFSWTLDETFYTGVKHNGSFINDISKALTG